MTETITSVIGDYGLYAVFGLMLVDAVFPAASELVMLYAGAVAAGAFAGQSVTFFGAEIESTLWAYVAMATAGTSSEPTTDSESRVFFSIGIFVPPATETQRLPGS